MIIFLLSTVNVNYTYRESLVCENGDYKYHCVVSVNFEWLKEHEEMYKCIFQSVIVL